MYPPNFQPTDIEFFSSSDLTFEIPKCIVKFECWSGLPINETFGGKPLVCVDNHPIFAELAIRKYFEIDGWDARWVETYGKVKPIYMSEWKDDKYKNQIHHPFSNNRIDNILANIAKENSNSYSGCWDIVAFKDDRIIFAEAKRANKDRIRATQTKWLAAGIRCGLKTEDFLVVQWDM
ncbi:MAG TPA: hypothetical protein PLU53_09390 [Bacteroidia bacterium]|nr:hypothetical protein [Bacteroidia bacterium]